MRAERARPGTIRRHGIQLIPTDRYLADMSKPEHIAVIGSGPSALYLLKHLLDHTDAFKGRLSKVTVIEKSHLVGMGMPYNPETTDRYNMSNISSEEIPDLPQAFADWLRDQPAEELRALGIEPGTISESEVYPRLALGRYFRVQFDTLVHRLRTARVEVEEIAGCPIYDIVDHPVEGTVTLVTDLRRQHTFSRVVIATGHAWPNEDRPDDGYFASPWPISKLLPADGEHWDFTVGTLGASLSAFDVVSSLAHRHGSFAMKEGKLHYLPSPGTERFKIVMHSAQGLLPHLQFDQVEPMREIYRHVDRQALLSLREKDGFLHLHDYFDKVCRPVLKNAFLRDGLAEMVALLSDPYFGIEDFVREMTGAHDYADAFEGMRKEMAEAKKSVREHQPIHWKEVVDDLMYTLNFHAEWLPAEDHVLLHKTVLPFLMNVVAAMPLPSGDTILALHDAGKLEIVPGKAKVAETKGRPGETIVEVDDEGVRTSCTYRMFIDCSGQQPVAPEKFPFPSLAASGAVRSGRAKFSRGVEDRDLTDKEREKVFLEDGDTLYKVGGVDITGDFRVIGQDGEPNPRIYDIALPHTAGVRPYSYGLQACNDTCAILVRGWVENLTSNAL